MFKSKDFRSELTIRPFELKDKSGVTALWEEVFSDAPPWNIPEEIMNRKLEIQPGLFIIAEIRNRIAGTAMGGYDGHRGWVHLVAVHPDFRRQGIGARLMERVEADLRQMNCPKLNLQVRMGGEEAVAFYKSLGYHVEERISMAKLIND